MSSALPDPDSVNVPSSGSLTPGPEVGSGPIEKKVTAATTAAFLLGLVVAVLNGVQDNPDLLGALPAWLQGLILVLIPTLVTFTAGYSAKHTHRPGART